MILKIYNYRYRIEKTEERKEIFYVLRRNTGTVLATVVQYTKYIGYECTAVEIRVPVQYWTLPKVFIHSYAAFFFCAIYCSENILYK